MKRTETTLSRRAFCQTALAGSLAMAFGRGAEAGPSCESALPHQVFANSFVDVPNQYGPTKVAFDQPLPPGLRGTLYRNGPARMQRGDTRYNHWFDGDGMVHAFNLDNQSLTHRARMVDTARSQAEADAGRFLWSGFGTGFPDSQNVTSPDDVNVANISVLPVGGDVLALWEAGSPYRVHAETLETLGRHVFSPETDGLPFSAHPRVDPEGRIWNFGYLSGSGKLVLYDINPSGQLNRTRVVSAPNADMVHDFAITDRYLVFVLVPLRFQPTNNPSDAFLDNLLWDDDGAVQILVIDKQDLAIKHRFELPPFFAFHLGNAWQDGSTLRIEIATAPHFDGLMENIVEATRGERLTGNQGNAQTAEITLDLIRNTASIEALPTSGVDFPRFDQRFTGAHTDRLFMLGRSPKMHDAVFGFNRITAFDRSHDDETVFDYGDNVLAEEHLFVPGTSGRQGEGWLVGTSYNWRSCRTTLSVFNAEHIADGPIAQAPLPYGLPLGLHGQFAST